MNSDVNKISCVHCNIGVQLKKQFNFSTDEAAAKNIFMKLKNAHVVDCIFKIQGQKGAIKFPLAEFAQQKFDSQNFAILSRKLIYVKWQEILVSLLKTFKVIVALPVIDQKAIETLSE